MKCPVKFISDEWIGAEECEEDCAWRIGVPASEEELRWFCAASVLTMVSANAKNIPMFAKFDEQVIEKEAKEAEDENPSWIPDEE